MLEYLYNEHLIQVLVSEDFPGWVVNLFISYRQGVESKLATFMLNDTWLSYSQAVEAGLATAKHWIDNAKP